jgi:hypothetical protein
MDRMGNFRGRMTMESHLEHYEIAARFEGRQFMRAEFKRLYHASYLNRSLKAMLPVDCCVNPRGGRYAIGTANHPKFLRWLGPGRYQMIEVAVRP